MLEQTYLALVLKMVCANFSSLKCPGKCNLFACLTNLTLTLDALEFFGGKTGAEQLFSKAIDTRRVLERIIMGM